MTRRTNVGVLIGAVLVVVGFCLAWVGIDLGHAALSVSGWEVARVAKEHGAIYYLVYLFPIGALACGVMSFSNPRLFWGRRQNPPVVDRTTKALVSARCLRSAAVEWERQDDARSRNGTKSNLSGLPVFL